MAEHATLTDPNLHEAKGASSASAGTVLMANGDGTATFQSLPVFSTAQLGSYQIVNSSTTPVALTTAATYYLLTNDAAGTGTQSTYGLAGIGNMWTVGTSSFLFSPLALGDMVELVAELDITTTTANTAVDVVLDLGVGDANTYTVPFIVGANIKTAGTYRYSVQKTITLKDSVTRVNPARVRARADTTGATVLVKSFNLVAMKR